MIWLARAVVLGRMTLQNLGGDVEAGEFGGAFVDFRDAGLAVATDDEW